MNKYYNLNNNPTNLVEILKDTVSIEAVAQKLDIISSCTLAQYGNDLMGDCPTGHDSTNHRCFSISLDKAFYYCFSCKATGNIISLVSMVKKIEWKEALRWTVQQFRPELMPLLERGHFQFDAATEKYYTNAMLYEAVYNLGKTLLYEPARRVTLNALTDRGCAIDILPKTEWIYFPCEREIRNHLIALYPNYRKEIETLPLVGHFGDSFRLALPYRDRRGAITGFLKRADKKQGITVKEQTGVRWDSTPGLIEHDLFGLDKIRKQDTLIVVEGYPDATYLPALGLTNVVAVGQGRISEKHIEGLVAKKVTRVIISFDNDKAKEDGTVTCPP